MSRTPQKRKDGLSRSGAKAISKAPRAKRTSAGQTAEPPIQRGVWRNRIIGTGVEDPEQLLANPKNWRIHPKAQQDALTGVLKEVGWVQNVIVNQRTGYVVDGHARVALAISKGEPVPVVYVDLDDNEESIVLAALDPLAAMAVTDKDLLGVVLSDLTVSDADLQKMFAGLISNDDLVPGTPKEPKLNTCPSCGHTF